MENEKKVYELEIKDLYNSLTNENKEILLLLAKGMQIAQEGK